MCGHSLTQVQVPVQLQALAHRGNSESIDRSTEFVTPDFVDYSNRIDGRESLRELGNMLHKGFPDLHWTIEDIVAEGDKVWVRTTMTGTHQGEYRGVPPTDEEITIRCVDIWRIVDGKIVEAWAVDDLLDFYKKLGIRVT